MSEYQGYLLKKCQKVSKMRKTKLENKIQKLEAENILLIECLTNILNYSNPDGSEHVARSYMNVLLLAEETLAKIKGDVNEKI